MDEFDPTDWPQFIELPGFTRAWAALGLHDADLRALQAVILSGPERHPVVPGTGGLENCDSRDRARDGARAVPIGSVMPATCRRASWSWPWSTARTSRPT
jgi:hypothetical protein